MDSLVQIVGVVATAVSALLFVFTLVRARREVRLRAWLDALRVLVSAGSIVAMTVVLAVATPPGVGATAVAIGFVVGLLQGRSLTVRLADQHVYVRRTVLGVVVFAAGLITMQVAALANRSGIVRIGVAAALLSLGVLLGTIAGRRRQVRAVKATSIAGAVSIAVMLVVTPMALDAASTPGASAQDGSGACPSAIGDLVLDDTFGDSGGDQAFIICRYAAADGSVGVVSTATIAVRWAATPAAVEFAGCGGEPLRQEGDGSIDIFEYGSERAVLFNVTVHSKSLPHDETLLVGAARAMVEQLHPLAQPCGEVTPGGPFANDTPIGAVGFAFAPAEGVVELFGGMTSFVGPDGSSLDDLAEVGFMGVARNESIARISPDGALEVTGLVVWRWDGRPFDIALHEALASEFGDGPDPDYEPEACFYLSAFVVSFDGALADQQVIGEASLQPLPNTVVSGCVNTEWDAPDGGPGVRAMGTFDGVELVITADAGGFDEGATAEFTFRADGLSAAELGVSGPGVDFAAEGSFFSNAPLTVDDVGDGSGEEPVSGAGDAGGTGDEDDAGLFDELLEVLFGGLLENDVEIEDDDASRAALAGLFGMAGLALISLLETAGAAAAGRGGTVAGPEVDELVSAWDPTIDNGVDESGQPLPPGGYVTVTRAERERLAALDSALRRDATQARLAAERDERLGEIADHEARMAQIEREAQGASLRSDLEDARLDRLAADNPGRWLPAMAGDFLAGVGSDASAMARLDGGNALYLAARGLGISTREMLDALHGAVNSEAVWDTIHDGVEAGPDTAVNALRHATQLAFGVDEAYDDLVAGFDTAAETSAAAVGLVRDNLGVIVEALTGADRLRAAADPDRPLHERLENYGSLAAEVVFTWATWGSGAAVGTVDEFNDAARAARAGESIDDVSGGARAARAAEVDAFVDQVTSRPRGLDAATMAERRAAWRELQQTATGKVDDFERALDDLARARAGGRAEDLAEAETRVRRSMLSVQGDKRALQEINHRSDDVKLAYNRTMNTTVFEKVDSKVVQSLAAELDFDHESMTNIGNMVRRSDGSWDETITVWRDRHGNELHLASPTNPSTTPKVGADRDFTARYKVAGSDDVVDVPHDHLRSIHYEAALSETIGADARAIGLPDDPKLLAQRMDHEITSGLHREAYTDLETILYSPAGQIQDPEQIRLAMRYKGQHWMRERVDEASELMGRNITEAELVEDYVAEGMRQVTKQFDNQVRARFDATNAARAADGLPPLRMPERLERSYEVLARVNPKPPARPTLSPVEAEMLLHDLGTSPTKFVDEIGAFMEMMEKGKTLT